MTACEIAQLRIQPERMEQFLSGIRTGAAVIAAQPGCNGVRVMRCLEDPDLFLLFADWEDVADHMRFRDSPAFGEYRASIQDTFAEPPSFQHYETVLAPTGGSAGQWPPH